jgi:5'(3')-deoxyribonucleotidase
MKEIMKDHNKKHPDHLVTYEQMKAFHYDMFHSNYDVMAFMKEPEVFLNLELMDNYVVDELKKINDDYDLIIVTSAFPEHVMDKWRWLQNNLPFIPHRNFCTFSRKDLLKADVLIDDAIHNVKDWVATGRPAIVPRHHWNSELESLPYVMMADGWKDMSLKIEEALLLK